MNLTREQKTKRAELKVTYLTAKIDRETKALQVQLRAAQEEIKSIAHVGYRVLFESTEGHNYGRYHDCTSWGWGSQKSAKRHATKLAEQHNAKVVDLYRDELLYKEKNYE